MCGQEAGVRESHRPCAGATATSEPTRIPYMNASRAASASARPAAGSSRAQTSRAASIDCRVSARSVLDSRERPRFNALARPRDVGPLLLVYNARPCGGPPSANEPWPGRSQPETLSVPKSKEPSAGRTSAFSILSLTPQPVVELCRKINGTPSAITMSA